MKSTVQNDDMRRYSNALAASAMNSANLLWNDASKFVPIEASSIRDEPRRHYWDIIYCFVSFISLPPEYSHDIADGHFETCLWPRYTIRRICRSPRCRRDSVAIRNWSPPLPRWGPFKWKLSIPTADIPWASSYFASEFMMERYRASLSLLAQFINYRHIFITGHAKSCSRLSTPIHLR